MILLGVVDEVLPGEQASLGCQMSASWAYRAARRCSRSQHLFAGEVTAIGEKVLRMAGHKVGPRPNEGPNCSKEIG